MARVRIVPTLHAMADVYRLPTAGGPTSPRFTTYVELARAGAPVARYNPMTTTDVLGTIEALLAADAEAVALAAARSCAERLELDTDIELSITVAAPGMWTDRWATEIDHRLTGRSLTNILLWAGEAGDAATVGAAAAAQVVRVAWARTGGPPATVTDAVGQEGLAGALAGAPGELDPAVGAALQVLGEDASLSSMAAVLYGDEVATALGWTPVGIGPWAGLRHAAALAAAALARHPAARLLRDRRLS